MAMATEIWRRSSLTNGEYGDELRCAAGIVLRAAERA